MSKIPSNNGGRSCRRAHSRDELIALSLGAVCLLASCTGDVPSNEKAGGAGATANASSAPDNEFPAGAAQALSVAGSAVLLDAGQVTAVNCAAAIHVTSNLLREMAQGAGEAEQAAFRQAEALYRQRALAAEGASSTRNAAAIDEQIERAQESPSSQARLAVACLRQISPPG